MNIVNTAKKTFPTTNTKPDAAHQPAKLWDAEMALTEREKAILRLKAVGLSDYQIARKIKMETPNVTRSRKNALKKIGRAKAYLKVADGLIS
jgi:DNA-binding NarL/FixJ family response regulator